MEENDRLITVTELKKNLDKYLLLAEKEDILITKNNKVIAKLSNPYQNRVEIVKSLVGILPDDNISDEEILDERLSKI